MDILKIIAAALSDLTNPDVPFDSKAAQVQKTYMDEAKIVVEALAKNRLMITTIPPIE